MPGVFTELYVANQVSELTKKSELPSHQKQNPKLLVKALDKIHNAGNELRLLGDEEEAYIHFVKVLNMHSVIKESIEYKRDKKYYDAMLNKKTIVDCMNQAEEISASLQRRYEEREARKAAEAQQTQALAADDQVDSGFDDPFDFTSGSEPAISKSNQSNGKPVTAASSPRRFIANARPQIQPTRSREPWVVIYAPQETTSSIRSPSSEAPAGQRANQRM